MGIETIKLLQPMVESLLDLSELLGQSTRAESERAKRWDTELKPVRIWKLLSKITGQ